MPIPEGYNNTTLKQKNRGLLFQLIATGDGISRTELAAASGLTKMAVSYIVADLLEMGLITEKEYTGDELDRLEDRHLQMPEGALNAKLPAKDYRHVAVLRAFRSKDFEASDCAMNVICRFFNGELLF